MAKQAMAQTQTQSVQQAVDMQREIERLQAENARLREARQPGLSAKVTDKGGVSVYGLGRFPVTLYKGQWVRLLDFAETLRTFMKAHDSELSVKE